MKSKIVVEIETNNMKTYGVEDEDAGEYDKEICEMEIADWIYAILQNAMGDDELAQAHDDYAGSYDYFAAVEDASWKDYGDLKITMHTEGRNPETDNKPVTVVDEKVERGK